ncbi:energy transducer TonB [Algoriphagus halophilus]|uniref:TonB protein C-terminal n=1 Tax=Algoriphagus halophilus TaxID=226505 RepID=A0A1N6GB48_9BACT|nr:energy transducer TonB [Algoriphagus halophilus]SIO04780.1 TonB protein C-terminal [Algoriphagus halophilus]
MKKLTSLFLILFFVGVGAMAQNSSGPAAMNQMLSKNVKYPAEVRAENKSGFVTLSISIDDSGYPMGEPTVYSSHEKLSEEILRTYALVKEKWDPSFLDGKKTGEDYLMTFEFRLSQGGEFIKNPLTKYKTPEKVDHLAALNKAIEENPYSSKLYHERGEYYQMIGENWLSKLDFNQSSFLKNQEITHVVIVGYGASNHPKSL